MHGVHVGMQGFHAYVLQGPHAQEQNGGSLRVPGKGAISATSIYTCLGQKVKGRVGDKAKDKWERSRRHA